MLWLPGAWAGQDPCAADAYRAFDFWLGGWEVRLADGTLAGNNEIRAEQQGCLLVERWRSAGGGTGVSLNYYSPVDAAWRQVWVSPGVNIDISGGIDGSSMVMTGTITYLATGARHPFRGTWTPLPDGRVRQYFEEAKDGTRFEPWFEGFYAQPSGPPPPPADLIVQ